MCPRCRERYHLGINPRYAKAYNNRGIAFERKDEYDLAISDYKKATEINPNYAEAYYNRAMAHFDKKDYNKSWENVKKAQDLGYQINPEFLEELRKASGREK